MTISSNLISIIIPTYNEENHIIPLLKSLIDQKIPYKYEIIVVDNESNDDTVKKVKNFIKLKRLDNLKIIDSKGKLGKVRNDGIKNAKGKWVAFIDADEIADPNWLYELMKSRKDYDIIIGTIQTSNPNINFISKFYDLFHINRIDYLKKNINLKTFGTGNLLVNYTIFEKGILFDNNFPTAEDGDFSYRLYKRRYKIGFSEKAIIYHKIPETIKRFYFFQKKMIIGKLLIFYKHRDFSSFIRIFQEIFFFISPNYLGIYKSNNLLSKFNFIFLGLTAFIISIYQCLNPFILFNLKKKITRPK